MAQNLPSALFLIFVCLLAAAILAIPIANWISEKLAQVLSFFSREKFRRSPPILSKGDALAVQGQVYPAFTLFRNLLTKHPHDIEIYYRLIDLAFGPMQDVELGDAIIAFGVKRLDKRPRRLIKERRNAIVLGHLYPLKHLRWRDETTYNHPKVEVPTAQKGQFAPKEDQGPLGSEI